MIQQWKWTAATDTFMKEFSEQKKQVIEDSI